MFRSACSAAKHQAISLEKKLTARSDGLRLTYNVIQRVDFLLSLEIDHVEFILLGRLEYGHLGPGVVQLILV